MEEGRARIALCLVLGKAAAAGIFPAGPSLPGPAVLSCVLRKQRMYPGSHKVRILLFGPHNGLLCLATLPCAHWPTVLIFFKSI